MARTHQTQRRSKFTEKLAKKAITKAKSSKDGKPTRTRREKRATKAKRRILRLGLTTQRMIRAAPMRRIVTKKLEEAVAQSLDFDHLCGDEHQRFKANGTRVLKPMRLQRQSFQAIHAVMEALMTNRAENAVRLTSAANRTMVTDKDFIAANTMNTMLPMVSCAAE